MHYGKPSLFAVLLFLLEELFTMFFGDGSMRGLQHQRRKDMKTGSWNSTVARARHFDRLTRDEGAVESSRGCGALA